jgi:hypothetical protein
MTLSGCGKSVAAITTLTVAVHLVTAILHGGPVAVPDVSAYLSVPQWLAGGILPQPLHFFPGYGMLLSPVGWTSGSVIHTAALILNGTLAGCCVLAAAELARKFNGPHWLPTCCAAIAALHPSLSMASRIAWPETLLTLIVLVAALMLGRQLWSATGLIVALAFSVHPRVVVLGLALIVTATLSRRVVAVLRGFVPGLALSALAIHLSDSWPWSRVQAVSGNTDGPNQLETLLGQWTALVATSFGLAAIGLIVSLRGILKRPMPAATTFLGVSALGMLILGAAALSGSDRVDTLLYGRYIGPWVVPLTIVGIAALAHNSVTRSTVLTALIPTLLSGVVLILARADVTQPARRIMTLGLGAIWATFGHRFVPTLCCALLMTLLGALLARRFPLVPIALTIVLAVSSTITNHHYLHGVGEIADGQVTTAQLVPKTSGCLAHDASTKTYALWLYRLQLPELQHRRVNVAGGEKPCSSYVVADDHVMSTSCPSAQRLGTEPRATWAMWHYPPDGCD